MRPDLPAHRLLEPRGAPPRRRLVLLHGILGSGRNWASVARRLLRARPDWGAVLVDLRLHGGSRDHRPPHTVRAAAADVGRLLDRYQADETALLGHSFGGKVALVLAGERPEVAQAWVIDASPSAGPGDGAVREVLRALEAHPGPFADREEALGVLASAGWTGAVAAWLASSLERQEADGSLVWPFPLPGIRALLDDYAVTDLWDVVERRAGIPELRFVRAKRSGVLNPAEVERLERARAEGRPVRVDALDGGHWLHVDAPRGLHRLLVRGLPD